MVTANDGPGTPAYGAGCTARMLMFAGIIRPFWASRLSKDAPSILLWLWSEVRIGGGYGLVSLMISSDYYPWLLLILFSGAWWQSPLPRVPPAAGSTGLSFTCISVYETHGIHS